MTRARASCHEVLQTYNQAFFRADAADAQKYARHVGGAVPAVVADGERLAQRPEHDLLASHVAHRAHGMHRDAVHEPSAPGISVSRPDASLARWPRASAMIWAVRTAVPEGASSLRA